MGKIVLKGWRLVVGIFFILIMFNMSQTFAESLPSKYDPRELGLVSPVKEQKAGRNTCWTYATDAVESYLIKNGESIEFSENYYNYLVAENATGIIGENPYSKIISSGGALDQGFSVDVTFNAMLDWKGPVYMQEFPDNITGYQPISKWQNLKPAKHVQGIITIPEASDNISTEENNKRVNKIKELVNNYGNANTSNYFSISRIYNQNVSKEQYHYYNHYSTIVGWDDTYSRDHFSNKPSQNGAFIVKNTWGNTWGYGGYYYISYEDWQVKLSKITSISSVESADNYDKKYNGAYKSGGSSLSLSPNKKRTISVTYARDMKEQEQLSAVSLRTEDGNIKYEIYISPNGKPKNGLSALSGFRKVQEGVKQEGGVDTIRLSKPVTLTGNEFSIAIVYQSPNQSWVPTSTKIANDPLRTQANYLGENGKWQSNTFDTYFITGFTNKKNNVDPTPEPDPNTWLLSIMNENQSFVDAIVRSYNKEFKMSLPEESFTQNELNRLTNLSLVNDVNGGILPDKFDLMPNLKKIEAYSINIEEIPKSIGKLKYLEELNWNQNDIKSFPIFLTDVTTLKHLYINKGSIEDIPEEIYKMSQLTYLDLRFHHLVKVPEKFFSNKWGGVYYNNINVYLEGNQITTNLPVNSKYMFSFDFNQGNNLIGNAPTEYQSQDQLISNLVEPLVFQVGDDISLLTPDKNILSLKSGRELFQHHKFIYYADKSNPLIVNNMVSSTGNGYIYIKSLYSDISNEYAKVRIPIRVIPKSGTTSTIQ